MSPFALLAALMGSIVLLGFTDAATVRSRAKRSPDGASDHSVCGYYPSLVGDGDPHQSYYYRQVTQNFDCGDGDCALLKFESRTFNVGFGGSDNAATEDHTFASLGFDVSETWTSGQRFSCSGKRGDKLCAWVKVASTNYTVKNRYSRGCLKQNLNPYVISAPNKDNKGGEYECKRDDDCKYLDAEHWDPNRRAGGP